MNSFAAIANCSRHLIDCYGRLFATLPYVMTSLRLHLKVVSLNHYKVNSVYIESIRTTGLV